MFSTPTSQPSVRYTSGHTSPDTRSGLNKAIVAIAATGVVLGSALIALVSFLFAAASFDGTTLFGCSDGTSYPDPVGGFTNLAFGIAALVVGFGLAGLLGRSVQKNDNFSG